MDGETNGGQEATFGIIRGRFPPGFRPARHSETAFGTPSPAFSDGSLLPISDLAFCVFGPQKTGGDYKVITNRPRDARRSREDNIGWLAKLPLGQRG